MSDTDLPQYSAESLPPIKLPQTKDDRRRKYFTRRAFFVYGISLIVIAAAILVPLWLTTPATPCQGETVPVYNGVTTSCVGLTDGSQVFDPSLAGVEALIRKENDRVGSLGQAWVGVAYLMPMTFGPTASMTREGVLHHLEGAYTAQWEANRGSAHGDLPFVKLYLVNDGTDGDYWQTAVAQIKAGRNDGRHVVAVAGLGNSSQNSRSAAGQLSAARLAMFGATITADDFDGAEFSGLVRVAPTNTDEVKAAVEFFASTPGKDSSALLVQDTDSSDDYVRTWSSEVQASYPARGRQFVGQPETFDRTLSALGDRFTQIAQVVCYKKPEVVFFAGRAKQLEQFVGALGGAGCPAPVTVISGDDAAIDQNTSTAQDYLDYQRALTTGGVTLFSTALANPNEWSTCGQVPASETGAVKAFSIFRIDYYHALGKLASPLDDGSAMMAHDAVITAIQTIRYAVQQSNGQQSYNYQEVTQNLNGLHDNPVKGASGLILISNYGGTNGDVIAKPLAIVQHGPHASVVCKHLVVP